MSAYILLAAVNVACLTSYKVTERTRTKIDADLKNNRLDMVQANKNMEKKLKKQKQGVLRQRELNDFENYWRIKLKKTKALEAKKRLNDKEFASLCILFIPSLLLSFIDIFFSEPLFDVLDLTIYPNHIGWAFLMIPCTMLIYNEYKNSHFKQSNENKTNEEERNDSGELIQENQGLEIPHEIGEIIQNSFDCMINIKNLISRTLLSEFK